MARVNKTTSNLKKAIEKIDLAYENMEQALEMLYSMSGLSDDLMNEMDRFDISAISSLKEQVEMILKDKI